MGSNCRKLTIRLKKLLKVMPPDEILKYYSTSVAMRALKEIRE